jgi:hypothetical protein
MTRMLVYTFALCAAILIAGCDPKQPPAPSRVQNDEAQPLRFGAMPAPGTSATALGKAEDAAHGSGDTGVASLAVRRDSPTSGASANGDYATLNVDANGRLYTTATTGTGATDTGKAEDAAHSNGDTGIAIWTKRTDTAASSAGTDGDYASLNTDASGRVYATATVTSVSAPTTVYANQTTVTTAGTEVTLGASQALTQGCWVKAMAANTGFMYVGLNGVTSTSGFELDALESVFVPIDNRTTIFVDSSVSGEKVSYLCF